MRMRLLTGPPKCESESLKVASTQISIEEKGEEGHRASRLNKEAIFGLFLLLGSLYGTFGEL